VFESRLELDAISWPRYDLRSGEFEVDLPLKHKQFSQAAARATICPAFRIRALCRLDNPEVT